MFRTYDQISWKPPTKSTVTNNKTIPCQDYKCEYCEQSWMSETEVDIHTRDSHKHAIRLKLKKKFCCPICIKNFSTRTQLIRHTKTVHLLSSEDAVRVEREIFVCDKCHCIYFDKNMLACHLVMRHSARRMLGKRYMVPCPKCYKPVNYTAIWTHMSNYEGIMSVSVCPICFDKLNNVKDMLEHVRTHPGYYYCDVCTFRTNNRQQFQEHALEYKRKVEEQTKNNSENTQNDTLVISGKKKGRLVKKDSSENTEKVTKDNFDEIKNSESYSIENEKSDVYKKARTVDNKQNNSVIDVASDTNDVNEQINSNTCKNNEKNQDEQDNCSSIFKNTETTDDTGENSCVKIEKDINQESPVNIQKDKDSVDTEKDKGDQEHISKNLREGINIQTRGKNDDSGSDSDIGDDDNNSIDTEVLDYSPLTIKGSEDSEEDKSEDMEAETLTQWKGKLLTKFKKQWKPYSYYRYFISHRNYKFNSRQIALHGVNLPNSVKVCILCREICRDRNEMKMHIKIHSKAIKIEAVEEKKMFVCPCCGEEFNCRILLKLHVFKQCVKREIC